LLCFLRSKKQKLRYTSGLLASHAALLAALAKLGRQVMASVAKKKHGCTQHPFRALELAKLFKHSFSNALSL
jgi:hypothetical protein